MIRVYTQQQTGQQWLDRYQHRQPLFACILAFTETGLIPGISAAGATPADRQYTCLADAEFLYGGPQPHPQYSLPPLFAGASPVLISRAVVEALQMPLYLLNAGLPLPPPIPSIDLGGVPAKCLTSGQALTLSGVRDLLQQGLAWGEKLAHEVPDGYAIVGECVVGGTTTALAVLMGLGVPAMGKINSSHPHCNHAQKLAVVRTGLQRMKDKSSPRCPLELVAAVGDPMQVVVAGMTIAMSRTCGVMLAGGTQMLAVYALTEAIARHYSLEWYPQQVAIGTTRWVVEDPTGDTVGLAEAIGNVPLMATQLSFATSRFPQLQAYERGYVKEGVGAGGCAIAAHLTAGWQQDRLLSAIEALTDSYQSIRNATDSLPSHR